MFQREDQMVNRYIIIFSAVASAVILVGGTVLFKCLHVQSVHVDHIDRVAAISIAGASLQKEKESGDDCAARNRRTTGMLFRGTMQRENIPEIDK